MIGNEPAEHQREVRNRQTGVRCAASSRRRESACRSSAVVVVATSPRAGRRPTPSLAAASPAGRGEERDGDGQAEENLGEAGVGRRDRGRQEEQDGQAAEHPLQDDRAERHHAQPLHPASRIRQPQPGGQDDREEADGAGDQPVAVLVEDAADPLRGREREHVLAVGRRPVGHREPGPVLVTRLPARTRRTVQPATNWRTCAAFLRGRLGRVGRAGRAGSRRRSHRPPARPCLPDVRS